MRDLAISCAFLVTQCAVFAQQFIGDSCKLKTTGAPGRCALLANCPPAIQALQTDRVFPQVCGFQGRDSIVCCPFSKPEPTTTKPTTPVRKIVGEKSRAKCKEYVQYVYEYAVSGAPPTADCGILEVPLIVGGENAKAKEFPHMALIGLDGGDNRTVWLCGGSLISEQFVLTAAHCLYDKQFGQPKFVRLGELVLNSDKDDDDIQDFEIVEMIRHPGYRPPSQYNDIALLKLNRKARLNPYVRPACLETDPVNITGKIIATGWGKVGFSADVSEQLLKVGLEFFSQSECARAYKNNIGVRLRDGIREESQICAGSRRESKDTCQGDSGGPLQIVHDGEFCMYKIVGLTSFGKACGVVGVPAVYTRVSHNIEWIEGIVWP